MLGTPGTLYLQYRHEMVAQLKTRLPVLLEVVKS